MLLKLYSISILLLDILLLHIKILLAIVEAFYKKIIPLAEKSVSGEIVLITGTGHGIGKELALQFAMLGSTVVCWDINEDNNKKTVDELCHLGYKAHAYNCDVSSREQVFKIAREVKEKVGDVTVVVNNAGIMPCHPFMAHNSQEIQRIFDINVMAHFWMLEAFLPSMINKNHGHFVALSSMAGLMGIANLVPYCASKYAVRGLMEAMAEELREGNRQLDVRFTTICPFIVDTGLCKKPRTRAACDPFLKCKLAFCKTIADECQPFLQRFQTSKPMTPYLFEAVEKLLRYLMNRCVKPDLMKCTGPKLLSIDTKKSENLILSKNIDIGFATKRLLGETAITVTERQKLEFIHECRSMLTTMIAKLQEKSPLKQKAVRGLSSLDPCVIQHSPQLAQKRFSFLLEELNHANIINDVLAENAKKEYLHFCNLKKSELQEIFRPCDQFSDEVGLDTIYGSFLIGEANYKHLWEVIKICLVLSHGNATVEGGFSVNKSLLVENMHEKTVIAQRHIHDEIQEAGGIKNIHISKKMLDYVRGARKRYHEYLEMKKQEKSEKDKKKAEKRKLDIQVKDLEGERKKLMMATEEKREAIDVELQELKKKQASLY
uniref:Short-chain dehydrogenase/reductase 3 n=1 Tax=Timema cristinae TaxID=61476 RepID=A0A7R9GSC5_TIMCR|nr:unnamed protein product [Timema cristinae]